MISEKEMRKTVYAGKILKGIEKVLRPAMLESFEWRKENCVVGEGIDDETAYEKFQILITEQLRDEKAIEKFIYLIDKYL